MATDHKVKVGRAATPPPPNVGSSSLGKVLQLGADPAFVNCKHVLCLSSPSVRQRLFDAGFSVFPLVPGLAVEAVDMLTVRAVVIEEDSLSAGVWSGTLTDVAPELKSELEHVLVKMRKAHVPVYWLRDTPVIPAEADDGGEMERAGIEDLPCPQGILIAPGSAMFQGTEEGAAPSTLVACLKDSINN